MDAHKIKDPTRDKIVRLLRRCGHLNASQIGRAVGISAQRASEIMRDLKGKGLVHPPRGWSLTPDGQDRADRLPKGVETYKG